MLGNSNNLMRFQYSRINKLSPKPSMIMEHVICTGILLSRKQNVRVISHAGSEWFQINQFNGGQSHYTYSFRLRPYFCWFPRRADVTTFRIYWDLGISVWDIWDVCVLLHNSRLYPDFLLFNIFYKLR